ncbi:hypothetical protein [Pontixanthobacter sp.]|uniref:hypothetical protein n=1 Tax=Pontixanthobacter sp. TaxID=2792078 RepID=UPI003C7BC7A1
MTKFAFPIVAAAALLGACSDDPETAAPVADDANAAGNVLEGSISDAMIPLDTLQSQSPPAAPAPAAAPDADAESESDPAQDAADAAQ